MTLSDVIIIYLALISILGPFAWWIHCIDKKQTVNTYIINESVARVNGNIERFESRLNEMDNQLELVLEDLDSLFKGLKSTNDLIDLHHPTLNFINPQS